MQHANTSRRSFSAAVLDWVDQPDNQTRGPINLLRMLVRLILITVTEFTRNDLSLRSGALTYTVLLSLVPVLAISTALGKGLGGGDQLKELAYTYIDTLDNGVLFTFSDQEEIEEQANTPAQPVESDTSSLTSHLRSAVDMLFAYVDRTSFATIGTIGVAGIFLSVILVFSNIEMAMNSIWHVEKSRSITRKVFDYLALMVLIPISIIIAFAASAFLKIPTLALKFQMLIPFAWLQTLILKLVPVFFISLTFYAIYIFFPNTKVRTLPAAIGSILAAMLWFGIQNVYITLQVGVSNYNAIYGSLATLPIFLVWMYLGWLFILGGAQVAYACQHLFSYRLTRARYVPAARLSGAFDIMDCVQKGFREQKALTSEELIQTLSGYTPALLEELLDDLVEGGLLHVSASSGGYLPAAPAERIGHSRIITTIMGNAVPNTVGGEASMAAIQAAADSTELHSPPAPDEDAAGPSSSSPEGMPSESEPGNLQEGQSST